ncbi:MAG: DUF1614 domain-containing protein [Deltaproteobacteria bacterium]|nr:DUF1614 domain-containing protein [Deltaproteobacteria bacterium]
MFFNPLTCLFMIIFFFLLFFSFIMVQIHVIAFAFAKIGIPSEHIFGALLASLLGSYVNIPLKKIPQENLVSRTWVSFYGFRHMIPVSQKRETVLAVNLGGAVIPTFLCLYLLVKTDLWTSCLIATAAMSIFTYRVARPVPGLGIALPAFVPPLMAALIAVIIGYQNAPVIAYVSGTLGTLIGADLMNLDKIKDLGAPVASIGGAGTFDGIFLNGILAVLLSAVFA